MHPILQGFRLRKDTLIRKTSSVHADNLLSVISFRRQPDDISDSDHSRRRLTKKVHPKMNSSSAASSVGRQRLERFGTALQCDLIGGRHYATNTGRSVAKS
jgi:hypothetical protein